MKKLGDIPVPRRKAENGVFFGRRTAKGRAMAARVRRIGPFARGDYNTPIPASHEH